MPNNENNLSLRDQLKEDLIKAMKARQSSVITALRSILSEIDNAEAVKLDKSMIPVVGLSNDVPRKILTEKDIHGILEREYNGIKQSLAEYKRLNKHKEADELQAELDVLALYLNDPAK